MVNSKIWGNHGWKFMHYVTLGYPEIPTVEEKNNYKNFFISLKNVLPCSKCAKHYEENLKKLPLTDDILNNKTKLIKWCIDLHNIVNKMLNKKVLSYDEAYNKLINNNNDFYDDNITNYEYINKSNNNNDLSNYANYTKHYDDNIEKYYKNINEEINDNNNDINNNNNNDNDINYNNNLLEKTNKLNEINIFNPFTLLLILLGLIIIALIFRKQNKS